MKLGLIVGFLLLGGCGLGVVGMRGSTSSSAGAASSSRAATTQGTVATGTTGGSSNGATTSTSRGATSSGTTGHAAATTGSSTAGSAGSATSSSSSGTTSGLTLTPLTFMQLPDTPDLVAPGRGAELWNGVNPGAIDIPIAGMTAQSLNAYNRFLWSDFEDLTAGQYDFTKFDAQIDQAIQAGQSFSFGIMPTCDGCGNTGYSYPTWLHQQMQTEAVPDWLYAPDGIWIPNWNSPSYLTAWENLLTAVAAHIQNSSSGGHAYADVIYYVDIRGYGDWGEWHTYPWYCNDLTQDCVGNAQTVNPGALATASTQVAIIDSYRTSFPSFPLVAMIATFDGNNQAPEAGYHALTAGSGWGGIGWRRDNWGDPQYSATLENNPNTYDGVAFNTLIMSAWQTGPIVGEPLNASSNVDDGGSQCDFFLLPAQVALYHATSFGNGNIPDPSLTCAQDNVRAASAASGYRLVLDSGGYTASIGASRSLQIQLAWKNIGLAPPYQSWNVVFELRDGTNGSVWSGTSSFLPKLFLPQTSDTVVTDTFTVPATVSSGSYTLVVTVQDPNGYRAPLPLAITGQQSDGSYALGSVAVP